jgi:hypothetical protein
VPCLQLQHLDPFSPLTTNIEASANSSNTGMDEDCVNLLESELATLQQMVDTQTTMLGTI